ncbi:MAG: type II toxin-antitoxin system RelE/ParE family toxin [Bacteriovoracaceae bacterium]|nr:type II toxin-antitoxin system RelE/ParE family toxin [Bacteriovoracaceae bacterium]
MKQTERLLLPNGDEPFKRWIDSLELKSRAKIYQYIDRVASGGAKKNIKSVGEGIFEIKINYGPGFRVYFGELDNTIILLLIGGDKDSQEKDIKIAKYYWKNYVQK